MYLQDTKKIILMIQCMGAYSQELWLVLPKNNDGCNIEH